MKLSFTAKIKSPIKFDGGAAELQLVEARIQSLDQLRQFMEESQVVVTLQSGQQELPFEPEEEQQQFITLDDPDDAWPDGEDEGLEADEEATEDDEIPGWDVPAEDGTEDDEHTAEEHPSVIGSDDGDDNVPF